MGSRFFSASYYICVFFFFGQGEHLIISNLGDSRAVLCTRDESNQLVSEQLTVDLKPNLPGFVFCPFVFFVVLQ